MSNILECFEKYYRRLKAVQCSSSRSRIGKEMVCMMQDFPEIATYWTYCPDMFLWADRFIKKEVDPIVTKQPTNNIIIFYDTLTDLKRDFPATSGLYFVGHTAFNPITNQEYYWVKIGMSTNLQQRLKTYGTYTPSLYTIDYKITDNCAYEESVYHFLLSRVALYQNQNSVEWWLVDKETYLQMCYKKFNYFTKFTKLLSDEKIQKLL